MSLNVLQVKNSKTEIQTRRGEYIFKKKTGVSQIRNVNRPDKNCHVYEIKFFFIFSAGNKLRIDLQRLVDKKFIIMCGRHNFFFEIRIRYFLNI